MPRCGRFPILTIATVCGVLALPSCGGGGDGGDGGTTVPPPTARTGTLSLLAGSVGGPGNLNGAGAAARFDRPSDVALDGAGNLYVADLGNHTIRKIAPAGVVSTFAGSGRQGFADGPGAAAQFDSPGWLATDAAGNVVVSDGFTRLVRKISPDGTVASLSGALRGGVTRFGSGVLVSQPAGLAVDAAGNVIVADAGTIDKITPAGNGSVLAGSLAEGGSADGIGAAARFSIPGALALDAAGNAFLIDNGNAAVRKVTPTGAVTTLDLPKVDFATASGIAVDPAGNLLIAVGGANVIRKVTPAGGNSIIAGVSGFSGAADGPALSARFAAPAGLAVDGAGNIFVADQGNATIRKIDAAGNVTTFAGQPTPLETYGFYLAQDAAGNVYVARATSTEPGPRPSEYELRKIAPDGSATTLASGLIKPRGMAVDRAGNVFVATWLQNPDGECRFTCASRGVLRRISPSGVVTKLAGPDPTTPLGQEDLRFFAGPVALDPQGNVYLAGVQSAAGPFESIAKIAPDGTRSTLTTNSGRTTTIGLAADPLGHVLQAVCEQPGIEGGIGRSRIMKIGAQGAQTLLAEIPPPAPSDGGALRVDQSNCPPGGIALDGAGNVLVARNDTIVAITPTGQVSTVAGVPGQRGITLGPFPGTLSLPTDVSVDAAGNLVVVSEHAVVKLRFDR